jgi:hypothetical protein
MFWADRSPREKITSALKNWVERGRFLWLLPYAWKALERGPSFCHIGRLAIVFATGIEVPFAGLSSAFVVGVVFVWCAFDKLVGRVGKCDLRKEARPAALIVKIDILKDCYCWVMVLLASFQRWEISSLKSESESDLGCRRVRRFSADLISTSFTWSIISTRIKVKLIVYSYSST